MDLVSLVQKNASQGRVTAHLDKSWAFQPLIPPGKTIWVRSDDDFLDEYPTNMPSILRLSLQGLVAEYPDGTMFNANAGLALLPIKIGGDGVLKAHIRRTLTPISGVCYEIEDGTSRLAHAIKKFGIHVEMEHGSTYVPLSSQVHDYGVFGDYVIFNNEHVHNFVISFYEHIGFQNQEISHKGIAKYPHAPIATVLSVSSAQVMLTCVAHDAIEFTFTNDADDVFEEIIPVSNSHQYSLAKCLRPTATNIVYARYRNAINVMSLPTRLSIQLTPIDTSTPSTCTWDLTPFAHQDQATITMPGISKYVLTHPVLASRMRVFIDNFIATLSNAMQEYPMWTTRQYDASSLLVDIVGDTLIVSIPDPSAASSIRLEFADQFIHVDGPSTTTPPST